MSDRPWFPFYPNDFRLKTLDLTFEQIGIYHALLSICWMRNDVALPDDLAWVRRALEGFGQPMHGHRFNKLVPPIVERFFIKDTDGKWRNPRLTDEHFKTVKLVAKGRESANKQWAEHNRIKNLLQGYPPVTQHNKNISYLEKARDWQRKG